MIEVTLLGTGSPMADPNRAGPVDVGEGRRADVPRRLRPRRVDAGRGGRRRRRQHLRAASDTPAQRPHHRSLRRDHDALGHDLHPQSTTIIGPPGTAAVVDATLNALAPDISYRIGHHPDITGPPTVEVEEVHRRRGVGRRRRADHHGRRPITDRWSRPSGSGSTFEGASVVTRRRHRAVRQPRRPGRRRGCACAHRDPQGSGQTDACATHQRHLDYHSSVEQAAATAERAGVGILVLTHYVPGIAPGQEDDWRALAATAFSRQIELGDDLHRVEVHPGVCRGRG